MTTEPPSLSTEAYSLSITSNEWLTTTNSDSSTTVVPIILPCLDCAPVIVWNIPELPNVEFNWPTLPELPSFHFPCFGFGCNSPPVNDGPPASSQTTNKPTETASSAASSDGPSSSDASSSTSSSESCTESTTVTDCRVACSVTASDASQTCYTTSCVTSTGCSLTGTTSTSVTTSSCSLEQMPTSYAGGSGPIGSIWTGNYASLSASANLTTSSSNDPSSSEITISSIPAESSTTSSDIVPTSSANVTSSEVPPTASASITSSVAPSTSSDFSTATASSATITSAPPITACALSTASAFTLDSTVFSESEICSCNDGWVAGLNTISLSDGYYELACAVGSSTSFIVSTVAPPITSCTLSTVADATMTDGAVITGGPVCDCNGGWTAAVNTVDGGDGTTLLQCAVETATIVVSTQTPTTTSTTETPEPTCVLADDCPDCPDPDQGKGCISVNGAPGQCYCA
ncbi:hypothetical protein LTS10_008773 [Elasticomyces elasticus]|nr:hypothetical protein LTS10_008773 [Elasticomyces elasticus]